MPVPRPHNHLLYLHRLAFLTAVRAPPSIVSAARIRAVGASCCLAEHPVASPEAKKARMISAVEERVGLVVELMGMPKAMRDLHSLEKGQQYVVSAAIRGRGPLG